MVEKYKVPICSKALKVFLDGLYIFKKRDFSVTSYSSNTGSISERDSQIYGDINKEVLIREYKKHIPECYDCNIGYIRFLNSIKPKGKSTRDIDNKYLDIHNFLKDQPINHHS